MLTLSPRLQAALDLAYQIHGHAARKTSNVPVLAHLLAVCKLVQEDGGDEDEAIAALLHDTLEDAPEQITRPEVEQRFGGRVLAIIEAATDTPADYAGGPKPPWDHRKQAYLDHISRVDPTLLRVTIADKVDNARSLLSDYRRLGDDLWSHFRAGREKQIWYYQACLSAYRGAGWGKSPLWLELHRLVDELTRLSA